MKTNVYKFVLVTLGLCIFAAALYLYRPHLSGGQTRVTVVGESQTETPPDSAVVTFSVVTKNAQAVAAQADNARKIEAVMNALKGLAGGDRFDIKTSNYNLSPEQDYSGSGMPKIVGYEARNTVTVTTEQLDAVGTIVDAATRSGANSVKGISFILREDSARRGDALGLATKQALAKAEAIAQSLGGRVSRIVETVEGGATPIPERNPFAMMNANATSNAAAYATRIQPGQITVRGQITLVVEIDARR